MHLPEGEHGQISGDGEEDEDGRSERSGESAQEWEGEERREKPRGEIGKTSGGVRHWDWTGGDM